MTDGMSTMQALRPKEHACATNLSTLCSAALHASWPVGSSGRWISVLAVLLPSLRNVHAVHQFKVPLSHIGAVCVASDTCMHACIHTHNYIHTYGTAGRGKTGAEQQHVAAQQHAAARQAAATTC